MCNLRAPLELLPNIPKINDEMMISSVFVDMQALSKKNEAYKLAKLVTVSPATMYIYKNPWKEQNKNRTCNNRKEVSTRCSIAQ